MQPVIQLILLDIYVIALNLIKNIALIGLSGKTLLIRHSARSIIKQYLLFHFVNVKAKVLTFSRIGQGVRLIDRVTKFTIYLFFLNIK